MVDPRFQLLEMLGGNAEIANALADRLDRVSIGIEAGPGHGLGASVAANLLLRLIPNVRIHTAETIPRPVDSALAGAKGSPGVPDFVVRSGLLVGGADLYFSSSRWSLRVGDSPHDPLVGRGPGAAAVGALVAGELVRRVIPEIGGVHLTGEFIWNLLDYGTHLATAEPDLGPVDAVCFGVGSVGSSMVQALLLAGATGSLVVVDGDRISPRNWYRYPLMSSSDEGPKVHWVAAKASESPLHIEAHQMSARGFLETHDMPVRLAVAAVDSVAARREVVDVLAKETLNCGVDGLKFHVSRHSFPPDSSCAYCQYVDLAETMDELGMYTHLSGLGSDRVAALLRGDTLTAEDVDSMVLVGRVTGEGTELIGGRLQDLARGRLYAQAAVIASEGGLGLSAPYVSGLAGSILASEVLKTGPLTSQRLVGRVDVDMSGFPTGFQSSPSRDLSGRCLCYSTARRKGYDELWRSVA